MIHLSPYLFFTGNCRDALTFYYGCLGGELSLQRYGESAAAAHFPAAVQNYIMHGTLTTAGFTIMAADAVRPGGILTTGNNVRTLTSVAWNAEIIAGDVAAAVRKLKQEPGQNLLIYGSSQLVEYLRQHDLIDTYRLMVFPVVMGSGKRLFTSETGSSFTLGSSYTTGTGVLALSYERAGKAS